MVKPSTNSTRPKMGLDRTLAIALGVSIASALYRPPRRNASWPVRDVRLRSRTGMQRTTFEATVVSVVPVPFGPSVPLVLPALSGLPVHPVEP